MQKHVGHVRWPIPDIIKKNTNNNDNDKKHSQITEPRREIWSQKPSKLLIEASLAEKQ